MIITVPAKELERQGASLGLTSLPVFAYAENGVTPLGRGEVHTVNVVVDQTTGTIKLKASFPNEQDKLWPGDFVDCKIVVEKRDDGLTVPTAAVHQGPKAILSGWSARQHRRRSRPVRVRQTVGGTALIEDRIRGRQSRARRLLRLQAGSRVRSSRR